MKRGVMRNLTLLFLISFPALGGPDLSRIPISFEPNRGQAPAAVRYLARGRGFLLTAESKSLRFRTPQGDLRMQFAGARGNAPIEAEEILPGKMNYLRTNDESRWHTGIPTYAQIRYRNLYSGIDLVCHGHQGDLEYDFILAPGARASAIRLDFPGIERLEIAENGDLVIENAGRRMVQHAPVIYQQIEGAPHRVDGHYVRRGARSAGFVLGAYDKSQPVIIDPTLVYASYVAAYGYQDQASGVAIDASGDAYVAGSTLDPQYGDQDMFVIELDPTGTKLLNAAAVGGSYDDMGYGVAVDSAGNVYIAGATQSPDIQITGNSIYQHSLHGSENAYIAVLMPGLQKLVWASYLGGSKVDIAYTMALDGSRNVFVAGATISTDFPTNSSSYQKKLNGGVDAFLTKLNANGALQFSTYFGGNGDDYIYGLATDSSGSVYATGSTASTNLPTTGGVLQASNAGLTDAFVAKFNNGGGLVYSTYYGGSGDDPAQGIAVDAAGNAYITGSTTSTNLATTATGVQPGPGGSTDAYVAKLNPAGSALVWATYLGGKGDDAGGAITVDSGGNVYVAGSTDSADFPVTKDAAQNTVGFAAVAFVSELSPDGGTLVYSTMYGGSGGDTASGIAVACTTGVFVAGTTQSTDFPVSAGAVGGQATGPANGFLIRFAGVGSPSINPNGVVNGADMSQGAVAPGSLIAIQGSNLAGPITNATGFPLPLTLGGVTVTVNGVNAPISMVSPGQINAQLPWETQLGTAQVIVNGCGQTQPMAVTVGASAPAIFQDANGHAVALNQDRTPNTTANPAKVGTVITVSLTGIGPVTNQPATGAAAPVSGPASTATLAATANMGGLTAPVQVVQIAPGQATSDQALVMVPALNSGDYNLVITIGGVNSVAATVSVTQ